MTATTSSGGGIESGRPSRAATRRSAQTIVDMYHRRKRVSQHSFFRRLATRPGDLTAVWLLMANLREGISPYFIRWLARTIERVEDRRVGSLLAIQLSDELGHGKFAQIHSVLLDQFVDALAAWRLPGSDDRLLGPGRRLAKAAAKPFYAANPYEGVGALIVGEIFAEQMDTCLAHEMRRQDRLTGAPLTWLDLHEKLEMDHAKDSGELAALIPDRPEVLAAARRGAHDQWQTLWQFLDDLHVIDLATSGSSRRTGRSPKASPPERGRRRDGRHGFLRRSPRR